MAENAKEKKNPVPFTIWTTQVNVERWKKYRELKSSEFKSQNEFVAAALNEYIKTHPITEAEKNAWIASIENL